MNVDDLKKQYGLQYSGRFICPICGLHKTHYRLYGYRCHNPNHTQQEERFNEALIEARVLGEITDKEYDAYLWGDDDSVSKP